MRKLLLSLIVALPFVAQAQQHISTFDSLPLPKADTFYVNYSNSGNDVGFTDTAGQMHFPCVYDTVFGGLWSTGFAYSNMTDSVTSGYLNMYSAKAAKGAMGSDQYAMYQAGYGASLPLRRADKQRFRPLGFWITNSTYAYNSMRDGDFIAKKFGGVSGNDSDWFKVTVYAYLNGSRKADSVNYYLADFRFAANALDYIVRDWRYVDLLPLGQTDSLSFAITSSDTGAFGMNTPGYFCMDHFVIGDPLAVPNTSSMPVAKVYPNPATDKLQVEIQDVSITQASVYDMSGRLIVRKAVNGAGLAFNIANFTAGTYLLKLEGLNGSAYVRFVKQ